MLVKAPSFEIAASRNYDPLHAGGIVSRGPSRPIHAQADEQADTCAFSHQVAISPPDTIKRRRAAGQGLAIEIVQSTRCERIEHRFCGPLHLLVVCEQGARQEGETTLGDLPRSTLHSLTRKLTFVPAGQPYHEWQEPRTPTRLIYVYFEPSALQSFAGAAGAEMPLRPRLFFEDKTLWDSALKLKSLIERSAPEDRSYFDALGAVLIHELIRLNRGPRQSEPLIRGGLATWQQRIVTAYIEDHLAESIPLMTLAQSVRLSPHYFCRAFKQTFGLPPHRYHTIRRIERAKALLAGSTWSVTEIGLRLGFSETSSFSTAFRKTTGQTPTAYQRGLV